MLNGLGVLESLVAVVLDTCNAPGGDAAGRVDAPVEDEDGPADEDDVMEDVVDTQSLSDGT